jgi:hypothetical protein
VPGPETTRTTVHPAVLCAHNTTAVRLLLAWLTYKALLRLRALLKRWDDARVQRRLEAAAAAGSAEAAALLAARQQELAAAGEHVRLPGVMWGLCVHPVCRGAGGGTMG